MRSVIKALLLGQRNDLSTELLDSYKNAGAIHILALSGLHIGILLLLLNYLFYPLTYLKNGIIFKTVLVLLCLWSFAFVAGLSASVVRAVTMFSFFAYGKALNRVNNGFNLTAISAFGLLFFNPNYLFQVGFQLSYAAVIAIIWIYPKLQRFWYPSSLFMKKGLAITICKYSSASWDFTAEPLLLSSISIAIFYCESVDTPLFGYYSRIWFYAFILDCIG